MRNLMWFTLLFTMSFAANSAPLTISVAANVKYAFDDLAAEFKKETGIEVLGAEAARKFLDFLFTPKARAIFLKYGYELP